MIINKSFIYFIFIYFIYIYIYMATPYRVRTIEDLVNAPRDPETGHFDMSNADLQGAILNGANFEYANFRGANLQGANLNGANLQWTGFENANLEGANLERAEFYESFLESANLRNANLRNASLQDALLINANLNGADLRNADMRGVDLRGADLRNANLENAVISGGNLNNADLRGANLLGTVIHRSNMTGANTEGINLDILQQALRRVPPRRAAAPAPGPQPAGAAYEIHNAYDKINVPDLVAFFESKIENGPQLGSEFSTMTNSEFLNNVINAKMRNFLSKLSPEELNSIPNKPAGYYPEGIRTWEHIWNVLYNNRITQFNFENQVKKELIGLSMYYASKQPVSFQVSYVLCYLDENAFAYSSSDTFAFNFSCSKGFVERFTTCLKAGVDTLLTTELPEDKKLEYKMLKNKMQGGYDVEVAKQLINEWQNDNKNIITENGEFRSNKEELVAQQKDNLFHYLCCELGVTQEELMRNTQVRETIDYMFGDDNILDNTLGGRRRKRKTRRRVRKTKKPVKRVIKTKRKQNKKSKTYKK